MYLGIEIGGTKLQLGVGPGDSATLVEMRRFDVDPAKGAAGIREQIASAGRPLVKKHSVKLVGYGFGGPVDAARGRVIKSHQIEGWDDFPLAAWTKETLGVAAVLGNDADMAGLAEAHFGAGKGQTPVFYVTVGTGIGGGLIVDGKPFQGHGPAVAEIGHLRPGLHADRADQTVESIASGWGIAAAAQAYLSGPISHPLGAFRGGSQPLKPELVLRRLIDTEAELEEHAADLLRRCDREPEDLTAKIVGEAARDKNPIAVDVLQHACQTLGWAIAQVITLVSPAVVVVGGGVSLIGEEHFFKPLRTAVDRYVFPPLGGTFRVLPAKLGEEMVIYGALALAAQAASQ
ncbi:MAG TPA: ROK family protein [Pirellulales bacterium]|nr:ROK family protein [Pirellulales bacterium]